MAYTEQEIEQIVAQLMQIKIRDVPVFIAFIQDGNEVYHKIYVDAGVTVARFEFKKADENRR